PIASLPVHVGRAVAVDTDRRRGAQATHPAVVWSAQSSRCASLGFPQVAVGTLPEDKSGAVLGDGNGRRRSQRTHSTVEGTDELGAIPVGFPKVPIASLPIHIGRTVAVDADGRGGD